MKKLTILATAIIACAGSLTATPTVTADLLSAGPSPLADSNHDYVGPYTLSVNGVSFAALCVDFSDNATLGQSYSAYETNLGSNLSNTYHPTYSVQYEEEAYLFGLITKAGVSNTDRINIQHAAWAITDSQYQADASAQAFVTQAQEKYSTVSLANFAIISGVNTACSRTQEFMIDPMLSATPEPSTVLLLSGGLLVIAGSYARRKRSADPVK